MKTSRPGLWAKYPFWCRLAAWILAPLLLVAAVGVVELRGSLPVTHGEMQLSGLHGEVKIDRDKLSIPDIRAHTDLDAYFALGFVHAQDRLWQMEMNRRIAAGRLSEVLGDRALNADRAMRRLDLANARKIWGKLDAENRRALTAYVDGVNAGINGLGALPVEFHLLNYAPEQWRPEDSLLLMQMMAWQFSGNVDSEIERLLLIQHHGQQVADALAPGVPKNAADLVATSASAAGALQQVAQLGLQAGLFGDADKLVGSNAWAVSGRFTASGAPLLANDPHLTTPLPGIWYLASLHGDRLDVSGATMPGLPFVLIGRNAHVAWGLTNAKADTEDVVLEELNPLNRNQYRLDGGFVDMDIHQETIRVRQGFLRPERPPETINIRRTVHGPMISDIGGALGPLAFSVRWTGDDDEGGTFNAFMKVDYASNWREFNDALSTFVSPIHNFVYADVDGNIGLVAPGLYPIRARGDGSVPTAGHVDRQVWRSFIPYDSVPRFYNPPSGILVTANNKLVPDSYPYHLTSDWSPSYRADRIRNEIDRRIATTGGKLTTADMSAIQADVLTPEASDGVLLAMQSLQGRDARQGRALALIRGWNGQMTDDSAAATLFVSWTSHLNALMLGKMRVPGVDSDPAADPLNSMRYQDNTEFMQQVLTDPQHHWCRIYAGDPNAACDALLQDALEHALNELDATLGGDESHWTWGRVHKVRLAHFPFSKPRFHPYLPTIDELPLSSIFDREVVVAGGNQTVNVASVSFAKDAKYLQFYGPMYREIIDLGHGEPARFMQGTGQSGNPLSPHYDDMVDLHRRVSYVDMANREPASTLLLEPLKK